MQFSIIRQAVGAGGKGQDLIVAGHLHVVVVEGKVLRLFQQAGIGRVGRGRVDIVKADIGVKDGKDLPDHILFDGGIVDVRVAPGKLRVLVFQQLRELGAVCVVLFIEKNAVLGAAQVVAVDHRVFGKGLPAAGFAAPIGKIAAVVIVFPVGVAPQVVGVIVVVIHLDHHIINGGAVDIKPANGILVLLLHCQSILQHLFLQLLELFFFGKLSLAVGVLGGGGAGRVDGIDGSHRIFAAGAQGQYHAKGQQQGEQACCLFHGIPHASFWYYASFLVGTALFYTIPPLLVNQGGGGWPAPAKKFGFCLQIRGKLLY